MKQLRTCSFLLPFFAMAALTAMLLTYAYASESGSAEIATSNRLALT